MIAGAFILAEDGGRAPLAQASTESALLAQIASRDTTGDGLPDWEKPLYGIPLNATTTDYFNLGMTDGAAVAKGLIVPIATADLPSTSSPVATGINAPAGAPDGTLTNAFAENFFTLYLSAKEQSGGADLTEDQVSALADQALSQLSDSISPAPDFKSAADLKIGVSGPDALKAFAANAEAVMATQGAQLPKSELLYLQDEVSGDTSAQGHIQTLAAAYKNIATGLAALPVPPELASADLALINSMARIGAASGDFARVDTDPVATMLALEQYPQTVLDMGQAFQGIAQVYASENVVLTKGTPGASFVNVMSSIASSSTP